MPAASRYRLIPILLSQVVGLLCGVASIRLNSHLIPPATLGFYGLFLTFTPLGIWVVHAGMIKFVNRNWAGSAHQPELIRELRRGWLRRLPWLALLAALAAGTMLRTSEAPLLVVWLLLFSTASLLIVGSLTQNALQASGAHWRDLGVTGSSAVLRSFAPPLLYSLWPAAASLLLGFSLHAAVTAGAGLWAVHTLLGKKPAGAPATAGASVTGVYGGPLFTALAVAGWVVGSMNRWLVAGFFGEQEAGYFTLIGGAAIIVTSMTGTIILQYLQPGFFALGDDPAAPRAQLARRVDLAALTYITLAGLALASVRCVLPWLVGPLISPVYRDALVWFVPAGCFGLATMTAIFYHSMLLAGRRESSCGPVDLSTAAVLAGGSLFAALAGPAPFSHWLLVTPLVPWLLTRTLARHYFFKPAASPTPSPGR